MKTTQDGKDLTDGLRVYSVDVDAKPLQHQTVFAGSVVTTSMGTAIRWDHITYRGDQASCGVQNLYADESQAQSQADEHNRKASLLRDEHHRALDKQQEQRRWLRSTDGQAWLAKKQATCAHTWASISHEEMKCSRCGLIEFTANVTGEDPENL